MKRNITIDGLRVLSILGVVLIHTTSRTIEQSGFDLIRIPLTLLLNQAFRFSVPLFFLISGYVLELTYKPDIKRFYRRRALRIIIPYLIWSIIYFLFFDKNSIKNLFSLNFVNPLLYGTSSIQLYFVPCLILFYIIFPFIRNYQVFFKRKIIWFTLAELILLTVDYMFFPLPLVTPLRIGLLNIYLFMLGVISSHYEEKIKDYIKRKRMIFIIITLVSIVLSVYESSTLYYRSLNVNYVTSQWRISIFAYTISLALLLFTYLNLGKFKNIIEKLSSLTFFVFFIHVFFISLFWKIIGSYLFSKTAGHIVDNVIFDIAIFIFVSICSFGTGYVVSFIPKIKTWFGIV